MNYSKPEPKAMVEMGALEKDCNDIWYNRSEVLSHNGLFNFTLGGRGVGKTFSFKEWAVTSPNQTVWVRRYVEDIKSLMLDNGNKFMMDLINEGKVPEDTQYYINENILYINDEAKVYFVGLSTARRLKSQSFPKVDKIIFDEFLEEDSRTSAYLKDEVNLFLGLYETVNRLRLGNDGRKDVRVFFLANKSSFVNPYFSYWHITPFEKRFKKFKDGLIVVENYINEEFKKIKEQTPFGKLIAGTEFGKFAIDNIAWHDDYAFVKKRSPKAQHRCNIRYNDTVIGIWIDTDGIYCSFDNNKEAPTFALRYEVKEEEYLLSKKGYPMDNMIGAYECNMLKFENITIKQYIFELMQSVSG